MVQYSPLCDTSILAYFAYLISSNGEFSFRDSGVGGSSGGGPRGDGGGYVGGDIVRLFLTFCDKNKENEGVLGGARGDFGVVRAFLGDVDVERKRHQDCAAGVSGDSYDSDIGGLVGGGVDGCGGECDGGFVTEKLSDDKVSVGGFVRGKNWKRNQKKRARRAGLRGEGDVDCPEENGVSKDPLRLSLERKWASENKLKAMRAEREIELLESEDLGAVKRLRERKVQGATERTMVQIEKAHASLVQTGNVPGAQPIRQGFCETVVDGEIVESVPGLSDGESKGCSISPSSSISEREVREMKKELEDLKLENEKLRRVQKRMPLAFEVMQSQEAVPVSVVDGSIPESAREALDKVIGNGEWTFEGDLDMDPNTLYLRKEFFGFS